MFVHGGKDNYIILFHKHSACATHLGLRAGRGQLHCQIHTH